MKPQWTILGSAAGGGSAERACTGYALTCEKNIIIIDCGSGVLSSFLRSGFDSRDVKAIIISHTHPDHISDLPLLVQNMYLSEREEMLEIYLPPEAIYPIRNYFNTCYLFQEKFPFEFRFLPIESNIELLNSKIQIEPIPNSHLKGNAEIIKQAGLPNGMECFSFLINVGNKSILYTADILSIDDILDYLDNIDLLVIETAHIDVYQLGELLKTRAVGKAVLSHLIEDDIPKIRQFAEEYDGRTEMILAEDNLVIEL
jgi:ribonuclease BN (tRNA processing enzyme)